MNIMIIEIKLTKEIIIHEYMKIATFLLLNIDNDRKWEYSNDVVSKD